jgi:hypothetical protein
VYRFDRNSGPVQFVIEGRRIFIENASFENYLVNAGRNETESHFPVDDILHCGPLEEQPKQAVSQIHAMQAEAIDATAPVETVRPATNGGQRELILPEQYAPVIVCFQSFLG